jgi:hypothetical protein
MLPSAYWQKLHRHTHKGCTDKAFPQFLKRDVNTRNVIVRGSDSYTHSCWHTRILILYSGWPGHSGVPPQPVAGSNSRCKSASRGVYVWIFMHKHLIFCCIFSGHACVHMCMMPVHMCMLSVHLSSCLYMSVCIMMYNDVLAYPTPVYRLTLDICTHKHLPGAILGCCRGRAREHGGPPRAGACPFLQLIWIICMPYIHLYVCPVCFDV